MKKEKFKKPPLSWDAQAELLIVNGLKTTKKELLPYLQSVNYYRLSCYFNQFQDDDHLFRNNTTFNQIWERYAFDRRLRLLVLDAIERFEISIKTNFAYEVAHQYGAFGYAEKKNYPYFNRTNFDKMIDTIQYEVKRSKENFVIDYFKKYNEKYLPIWKATEVVSLGCMLTLYGNIHKDIRQDIAQAYKVDEMVLLSWFKAIHSLRNICAHQARLWNRVLGMKPLIPKHKTDFFEPVEVKNDKTFGVLTILKYLIDIIAPQSHWFERLKMLFNDYPEIPLDQMGFPENWEDCPIWKQS